MESSNQIDATFFSSSVGALNALSSIRNHSRVALSNFLTTTVSEKHEQNAGEQSDDDTPSRWSESDSESSDDGAPSPKPIPRAIPPPLHYWDTPRRKLLDLPLEIIEHIAYSLREPKCSRLMDMAALYISDRYHDFSEARHPLSALTSTCWFLRSALERVLYRNIQLDLTGWKGLKHTAWPAASLKLLLQTLETRPELASYIHVAALDFPLTADSVVIEEALDKLLSATTNLKFLCLAQCPLAFWDHRIKHIKGFATSFAPGILPSILEDLSSLEELHLRDSHVMSLNGSLPRHKIRRARMDSSHEHASAYFCRLLTIFGATLLDLDVRFIGGLQQRSPLFLADRFGAKNSHFGGQNLRFLRLDNISVLSNVSSTYAHILRGLPSLEMLHVTHHAPLAPSALGMLPASLRVFTTSEYYGLWTAEKAKDGFLTAFAACIEMRPREIVRVEGSSGVKTGEPQGITMKLSKKEREAKEKRDKERDAKLDIAPVMTVCVAEGLPFNEVEDAAGPFVRVFFGKRPIGPEWAVHVVDEVYESASESEDDDGDD
ncbi:Yae1-N domain-containing protein [Mycena indigotica]|uniref:Yae1-N domain-containing protein n=1 Tax=Mycena indigotica TaxID=2126181 RepID=A0A8H6SD70_9AGAR|nr:Yae1-N domain-containing protein [Mycena indigotica]KAF7297298.1 Yae1-N domain-containing protein [Mycena indigotica]